MPDPGRLTAIVEELGGKPSYASGDRRLPQPVTVEESVAIVAGLASEVDKGVRERARLAERQHLRIHCHAGCTNCCNIVVMVYRPEAERVAAHLRRPDRSAALARFREAYPRWKERLADLLPTLEERSTAYRDQGAYFDLLIEATRRRSLCAFNHDGRCAVYPDRPLGCRNAHALDTDAYCANDHPSGRKAAALAFVPLDTLMGDSARLMRAVHNSMEGTTRHRAEALCEAVARLLGIQQD